MATTAEARTWLGSHVTEYHGSIGELSAQILTFDRRPFSVPTATDTPPSVNPRADMIVRLPRETKDPAARPTDPARRCRSVRLPNALPDHVVLKLISIRLGCSESAF